MPQKSKLNAEEKVEIIRKYRGLSGMISAKNNKKTLLLTSKV